MRQFPDGPGKSLSVSIGEIRDSRSRSHWAITVCDSPREGGLTDIGLHRSDENTPTREAVKPSSDQEMVCCARTAAHNWVAGIVLIVSLATECSAVAAGRVPLAWNARNRNGRSYPLRLRGGGAGSSAPKYQSNTALKRDEYHVPFGTILRSRSGALFAPTPTPKWFEDAIIYQIYPLGSPGREGVEEGGGFFGDVPQSNDLVTPPQNRLKELSKFYDHLESLGITAIYFSPLFESETHGYTPPRGAAQALIFA